MNSLRTSLMKRTISACLVAVFSVVLAWHPTPAHALEGYDSDDVLGYIGCSMTRDTFTGYAEIGATLAWPVGTYNLSGGVLGAWVVRGSRWRGDRNGNFEGYVQKRNAQAPAAVLVMVCANTKTTVKVTDMQKVIGNIAYFSPGVDVYLTSQPRYTEGHLCTNLATSLSHQVTQFATIDAVIAAAIANDWAEAGLTMPVLKPSQLRDTCHANAEGRDVLGRAILGWWQ
jgi:hypothetical protein